MEQNRKIKPGLFALDLNISIVSATDHLEDIKLAFERNRKDPTPYVYNALDCMIAFIDSRLPRSKQKAIERLETVLRFDHDHLNALADLGQIYRRLFRHVDADKCDTKIREILESNSDRHMKSKAICLLEQGYSILFEKVTEDAVSIAFDKSQELSAILHSKYGRSSGERKDLLKKALAQTNNICSNLQAIKDVNPHENNIIRKFGAAIDCLQNGLQMMESSDHNPLETVIWKYYIALAFNRLESHGRRKPKNNKEGLRSLELFWEVLVCLKNKQQGESVNFYIARSYVFIGHILISRRELIKKYVHTFPFRKDEEYKKLSSDPLEACRKARSISPNDIVVLNRYARSLLVKWESYIHLKNKQIEILENADALLTESIKQSPKSNWGAYTLRIELSNLWISNLSRPENNEKIKTLLERALHDGRKCLETAITEKDCLEIVQVCHMLAKFPCNHNCYGPEFVKNKAYIYEALTFLNQGLKIIGRVDSSIACEMGTCFYELEDYRNAIEWTKRAMFLSDSETVYPPFRNVCLYLCRLYASLVIPGSESEQQYILEELMFVFLYMTKYSSRDKIIRKVSTILIKSKLEQVASFVKFIYNSKYQRKQGCLDVVKGIMATVPLKHRALFEETRSRAEKAAINSTEGVEEEQYLDSMFVQPSTSLPRNGDLDPSSDYKYDFFVYHSDSDRGWVKAILLRQLENSFGDLDKRIRGCFDERDFVAGKPVIDNILDVIARSNKIVLILSPSFVQRCWCNYENDDRLSRSINQKLEDEEGVVIPVMIEKCELPVKLSNLLCFDITGKSNILQKIIKLKYLLSN